MKCEMNRRSFVKFAAMSATVFACTPLVGCGAGKDENLDEIDTGSACNLAIVYALRSNSAANLSAISDVKKELNKTVAAEAFLAIVLADGNPQSASTTITLQSTNETRRRNEIRDDVDSILETDFVAQSPEVDIFKAISKADNALAQAPDNGLENLVMIIDSGISTTGAINFTDSITHNALLNPSSLVNALQEDGELVRLSHIDKVVWYGLGLTCGDQEDPKPGTQEAMKGLYRTVFEAAGVDLPENNEEVFKACDEVPPEIELPSVTVVDMPRVSLDENGKPTLKGDKLEFDEGNSSLVFEFGTSEFSDSAKAEEELRDCINQLIDFPGQHVVVRGYTDATGLPDANQILSEQRAAAVAALLESAGVNSSQITVEGKGESTKFDTDERNRRVEIELV